MTDVATIDHSTRFERAWGVLVGDEHYRADVLVLPLGNQEPPTWMTFTLRPLPTFPAALPGGQAGPVPRTPTLADWFMVGAGPHVAEQACELLSVKLTKIDAEAFTGLAASHQPEPIAFIATPDGVDSLTVEDFAGPNRAQRRSNGRAMRRRPRR